MKALLICLLLCLIGCEKREWEKPKLVDYNRETTLMLNITKKFLAEKDAKVLNKVSNNTLKARVVRCTDHFGECREYGQFLSLATQVTQDGNLTEGDKKLLVKKYILLEKAILSGRKQLSK